MMTNKIVLSAVGIVMGIGLYSANASAGLRSAPPVTLEPFILPGYLDPFIAKGSIGNAHNSASAYEEIGCVVRAYGEASGDPSDDNDKYEVECIGRKSDGTPATCSIVGRASSGNPDPDLPIITEFVNAIGTINGSSYIEIEGFNQGLCTGITVDNNSKYVAKNGAKKAGIADESLDMDGTGGADFDAKGSLASIRITGDNTQYMGCTVSYSGTTRSGSCFAFSPLGFAKQCFTARPHVINLLTMLKSDSWLLFPGTNPADGGGECGGQTGIEFSSKWRPAH